MSSDGSTTVIVESTASRGIRSPSDVLRLAVAALMLVLLLLVQWLFGDTLTEFAADLLRGLDAVPQWIIDVVLVGTRVLAVVLLGGGFVVMLLDGRFRFLLTVGSAAVAAGVLAWLLDRFGPSAGTQRSTSPTTSVR